MNQIINQPNQSWVEDNINIYQSRGVSNDSPIKIHDNYLYGAFPVPANAPNFTGSGITVDGNPGAGTTLDTIPAYIQAYNNQVVKMGNACMNIATGHDVSFHDNRMVMYPYIDNGATYLQGAWAGCAIFNGSNLTDDVFINNQIVNNTIGYMRPGINYKYTDRQDEMNNRGTGQYQNRMPPDQNIYLPNPITQTTEDNEFTLWQQKLQTNNITIGADLPSNPTILILNMGESNLVGRALTVNDTLYNNTTGTYLVQAI